MWSFSSCAKFYHKYKCSHCLLYWNEGIVYCIFGQCLIDSESRRKFHRLDGLSIPNHVIKTEHNHGARHGKTKEQTEYHIAWNASKRCCKKVDSQGEHFTVFTVDFSEIQFIVNHNLQSDGQHKSAQSGTNLHKKTIHIVSLQRKRKDTMDPFFTLNKAGKNGPMRFRSDFRAAVSTKNRPHHESGEQVEEPIHPDHHSRWHSLQAHRGGTSLKDVFFLIFFLSQLVSSTVDSDPL